MTVDAFDVARVDVAVGIGDGAIHIIQLGGDAAGHFNRAGDGLTALHLAEKGIALIGALIPVAERKQHDERHTDGDERDDKDENEGVNPLLPSLVHKRFPSLSRLRAAAEHTLEPIDQLGKHIYAHQRDRKQDKD